MVFDFNLGNKKVYKVLSDNYGLGIKLALFYCRKVGLNKNSSSDDITKDQIKLLTKLISQSSRVGVELKRSTVISIQNKIKLRSYQGIRHTQGLPVNGQNTKNNAKTSRRLSNKKLNINEI